MSTTSIQKLEENQSEMTPEDFHMLFNATMEKDWTKVEDAYRKNITACMTKLTKYEETALHIAVSLYKMYKKEWETDLEGIEKIVKAIPNDTAMEALGLKDTNGNTPLHLAAGHGSASLCEAIASKRWKLNESRNNDNETPLFLAARCGKMDAFFCLRKIYKEEQERDIQQVEAEIIALCRGRDGNTVLHLAISGGYLRLAYRIIQCHPKLVDFKNVDGESPLHVLARKRDFFKSYAPLSCFIIYNTAHVPMLKEENCDSYTRESRSREPSVRFPENYETCVGLYQLLHKVMRWFLGSILKGYNLLCRGDEESGNRKQDEKLEEYPPNYNKFVGFFSFVIALLVQISTGSRRVWRIRERKERHTWALQIMNKLIALQTSNLYRSNGEALNRNVLKSRTQIDLPAFPPPTEDGNDNEVKVEVVGSEKKWRGSAFLLAAKMGITEMVEAFLDKFKAVIADQDQSGKNVLLLAIEHRQIEVFQMLIDDKRNLPEYVFNQVDHQGNTANHLAATYQPYYPWRGPGPAVQVHGDYLWFKHVKKSLPPLHFPLYNKKGETPRDVFRTTHQKLSEDADEWLVKTSGSCSIVAVLIATVAFTATVTVPGGFNGSGKPVLINDPIFNIFSWTSYIALYLSLASLICFLAIIMSGYTIWYKAVPVRLLIFVFFSLLASIVAILVSFCAGHFFVLQKNFQKLALYIYVVTFGPTIFFISFQLGRLSDIVKVMYFKKLLRYRRLV